jgi:hypothetical protein
MLVITAAKWIHRGCHPNAATGSSAQSIHEAFQLVGDPRTKRCFEVR